MSFLTIAELDSEVQCMCNLGAAFKHKGFDFISGKRHNVSGTKKVISAMFFYNGSKAVEAGA